MRLSKRVVKKIIDIVGGNNAAWDREELLCYSYDATGLEYPPDLVVFPQSTGEISEILKIAHAERIPVVPRGAGSGMTGGALPVAGGIVLVTSRLNRILEIDVANQIAVVEPGVVTGHFQEAVKKLGLYYPPDPASLSFCTMGGNAAECAGGPSAVKYGVTRDYVLGLEVVVADGRVIKTGVRTAKGVVGYDLTRLFVGSEGTLGVITKIIVRLLPLPEMKKTLLVLCDTMVLAVSLVTRILRFQTPCTLEYMDRTALSLVSKKLPGTVGGKEGAVLIVEFDGDARSVIIEEEKFCRFLERDPGVSVLRASDKTEAGMLWEARRALSPEAFKLKPHKLSEDVVVPRSRIPDLVSFVEALSEETGLVIFTFGHAGDGNIHVNLMYDKTDEDEVRKAKAAKARLLRHVVTLGGTLSGEHGVGLTKAEFLSVELGEATIKIMQEIKKALDPENIMNPGKIFIPSVKGD